MLTKTELQERRALFAADGAKAMAEYLAEPEAIRARTAHLKTLRLERAAVEAAEKQKAVAIKKKGFPAVTNAIYAATGKRLRKLPIDPTVLKQPV